MIASSTEIGNDAVEDFHSFLFLAHTGKDGGLLRQTDVQLGFAPFLTLQLDGPVDIAYCLVIMVQGECCLRQRAAGESDTWFESCFFCILQGLCQVSHCLMRLLSRYIDAANGIQRRTDTFCIAAFAVQFVACLGILQCFIVFRLAHAANRQDAQLFCLFVLHPLLSQQRQRLFTCNHSAIIFLFIIKCSACLIPLHGFISMRCEC